MKPDPLHKVTDFDILKKSKGNAKHRAARTKGRQYKLEFHFYGSNLTFSRGTPHDPSSLSRFSGEQSEIEGTLRHARHDLANKGVLM